MAAPKERHGADEAAAEPAPEHAGAHRRDPHDMPEQAPLYRADAGDADGAVRTRQALQSGGRDGQANQGE